MIFFQHNDGEEEVEEVDDEESALADDLLDEVGDDAVGVDDELEGFGLLSDDAVAEEEEEKEEDDEEEASLDEDAEDVDFDTFDDVDEM